MKTANLPRWCFAALMAIGMPTGAAHAQSVSSAGSTVATAPDCIMDAGPKRTYLSCNGFSISTLTAGMNNYAAEGGAPGTPMAFVYVHAHAPATPLRQVGSGDSWSNGRKPSPPSDYLNNNGETAGYLWIVSNAGGSLGVAGYDKVIPQPAGIYVQSQLFLGNIHSQLAGPTHGRLMRGEPCSVAGITGHAYFIVDTSRTLGEHVQSRYCIGDDKGPLLSSELYLTGRLMHTWTVTQVGGIPIQSPPPPLVKH